MVTHRDFVEKRMLSFRHQPYLRDLRIRVGNLRKPLTIVIGAGVSMNSGLRSWPALIENMIPQIGDKGLQAMAEHDKSDLMRKAEIVLTLINPAKPKAELSNIIRRALYPDDLENGVGQLALSIARLVAARRKATGGKGEVRLITTNFDKVVELALQRYFPHEKIRSYGLNDAKEWRKAVKADKICVLHMHGIVEREPKEDKLPIVLTESQFLRHGADARELVYRSLKKSCTLFVGLSMTDPNLVGPLYQSTIKGKGRARFALVVPEPPSEKDDAAEAAHYAIESSRFMKRKLRLRTIFLKSYSQLNQVLAELSLAVVEPKRYKGRPKGGARSLVYDRRLKRKLDSCYRDLGCGRRAAMPVRNEAARLNKRLHRALHAPDGPIAVLRGFACAHTGTVGGPDGERFALFLWLRARPRSHGRAHYALNLIGTSAYVPRDDSAAQIGVPICRGSAVTAAQAVFLGSPIAANSHPTPGAPAWRGIVATPIVAESTGSAKRLRKYPVDQLTIGAISLHTTRFVRDTETNQPSSIISELDSHQLNKLFKSLERAVRKVL
ncbi:SIR2 family protein [Kutzneria sp. 744]|uniref:SIR2 family protein n=1 Tax=Kutzneria sp. (strain 744) TaxID=345341 RepID=UPI0004AD2110|nr:SIR2 family protein [Kutzneria sp. 744]